MEPSAQTTVHKQQMIQSQTYADPVYISHGINTIVAGNKTKVSVICHATPPATLNPPGTASRAGKGAVSGGGSHSCI